MTLASRRVFHWVTQGFPLGHPGFFLRDASRTLAIVGLDQQRVALLPTTIELYARNHAIHVI